MSLFVSIALDLKTLVQYGLAKESQRQEDLAKYKVAKVIRENYLIEKYGTRWYNAACKNKPIKGSFQQQKPKLLKEKPSGAALSKPYEFINEYTNKPKPQPRPLVSSNLKENYLTPNVLNMSHNNNTINDLMLEIHHMGEHQKPPAGSQSRQDQEGNEEGNRRMKIIEEKMDKLKAGQKVLKLWQTQWKNQPNAQWKMKIDELEAQLKREKEELLEGVTQLRLLKMDLRNQEKV